MVTIAAADRVDRDGLLEFVRERHHFTLMSVRREGRPHLSPVTGGVDADGRLVVSTYPGPREGGPPAPRPDVLGAGPLRGLERLVRAGLRHGRGPPHAESGGGGGGRGGISGPL